MKSQLSYSPDEIFGVKGFERLDSKVPPEVSKIRLVQGSYELAYLAKTNMASFFQVFELCILFSSL